MDTYGPVVLLLLMDPVIPSTLPASVTNTTEFTFTACVKWDGGSRFLLDINRVSFTTATQAPAPASTSRTYKVRQSYNFTDRYVKHNGSSQT
jgi:hypothetical protein